MTSVELFLDYAITNDINLNIPDGQGRTANHHAYMHRKLEVVKLLLEKVEEEYLGLNVFGLYSKQTGKYSIPAYIITAI